MDYMCLAKAIGMVLLKFAAAAAVIAAVAWIIILIIEWCSENDNFVTRLATWIMYAFVASLVMLVVATFVYTQYQQICK